MFSGATPVSLTQAGMKTPICKRDFLFTSQPKGQPQLLHTPSVGTQIQAQKNSPSEGVVKEYMFTKGQKENLLPRERDKTVLGLRRYQICQSRACGQD